MQANAHLRVVRPPDPEPTSVTRLFHRVARLLPDKQQVLKIPPDVKVSEALALMEENNYSQLPIVEGDSVLGVFSYRSFTLELAKMETTASKILDLPVDEFIEKPIFAGLTDEFSALLDQLESNNVVLVGHLELLQGIVTPIDVLQYLYGIANAFVLIEEIELSLRAMIRMAVDEAGLKECIQNSLSELYKPDKMPTRLEDMTLNDAVQVIRDGRNWEVFHPVFGGTRERVGARLASLPRLRNDVFHFKREITVDDHQTLAGLPDWLLMKLRAAEAKREGKGHA